jgi:hypothetical protein
MSSLAPRLLASVAVLLVATSVVSSAAAADEKKACVAAYEQSQVLRNESKLADAKKAMLVCARDVCPAALRTDCVGWLSEVEASIPSVVVDAKDRAGKDLASVRVSVDGKQVLSTLDGKPMVMDPGAHTFRYEASGFPPIEEQVVVKTGEKNRKISVVFKTPGDAEKGTGGAAKAPPPVVIDPTKPSNRKTVAYVLGGVGIVALGAGTFFYVSGKGAESDLRDQPCAATKTCAQTDVDDVKKKYLFGDIAMATGVVSLGVGAFLYFTAPKPGPTASVGRSFDVAPTPGGGFASYSGRFLGLPRLASGVPA